MAKNGETKEASKLATITDGVDPKKADMKLVKSKLNEYMKLEEAIKAANDTAAQARQKQFELAEEIVKQTGKAALTTKEGARLVPTCRGENVFFKNQAELDSISV